MIDILQHQSNSIAQPQPQRGHQTARKGGKQTSHGAKGGRRSTVTTQHQLNVDAGGGGDGGGNAGGGHAVNWDPECRRGGWFLRQDALERHGEALLEDEELEETQEERPIPENQVLFSEANHFLSCLAAACRSIVSSNSNSSSIASSSVTSTSAISLLKRLVAENPWDATNPYFDDSLLSIALRCKASEDTVSCAHFISFLNQMQFRVKVERYLLYLIAYP